MSTYCDALLTACPAAPVSPAGAADGRTPAGAAVDSARQNLASSFVNAFVNAGFGADKLVTPSAEGDAGEWGLGARRAAAALFQPLHALQPFVGRSTPPAP